MRHGGTLLELVASLTIFGLLIVGMQSSVIVAIKTIPSATSPITVQSQAQRALDVLSADLQSAITISEFRSNTIAFTVPDRNGDGRHERLRYSWNGTSGGPLTRQINGGTEFAIVPNVQSFALASQIEAELLSYPALCVEDANESMLIDRSTITESLEHDVSSTQSIMQRFSLELPTNSYAWRPTRIQLQAKYAALFGAATVQLRTSSLTYLPGVDVLQQQLVSWLTLANNFSWHSFGFADVEPLPSGGSFSLVLQRYFGSRAVTLMSSDSGTGLLKGNGTGSNWELQDGRGLVCQLFGKQWRATGTRSLTLSKYSAMEIRLQTATHLPALQTGVALLNKPGVLANDWNLDFKSDPTLIDTNGNGQNDWSLGRSGAFSLPTLTPSGWQTGGDQLVSTQDWSFNTPTIIEFTAQSNAVGDEGATINVNVLRSGSTCVPLTMKVKRMPDGTQSLFVQARTSDTQTATLFNLSQQSNRPLPVKLIIDPAISAVSLFVGEVAYGTFGVAAYTSNQNSRRVTIGTNASSALFQSLRIRSL